jgi:replicative DNA helicase
MMLDNDCVSLVQGILRASDFTTMPNRAIWKAIEAISGEDGHPDAVTVLAALRGSYSGVSASDLSDLMGSVPSAVMAERYAEQVKRASDQRNIITAARAAAEKAYALADPEQIIAELNRSLEAGVNGVSHFVGMKQALDEFDATFNDDMGFLTGLVDLDAVTGGVYPGVNLVTGMPGAGKTTLCVQILLRALRAGHRCVVFSADQPRAKLAGIMASQYCRVPVSKLPEHKTKMRELEDLGCFWYEGEFELQRISAAMRSCAAQGYTWSLVDYLSLISVPGLEPHYAAEEAEKELKRVAHMAYMTLLVVQSMTKDQQARGTMEVQHVPEQIWHIEYDEDKPGERIVKVKKNRNGAAGRRIRLEYGGAVRRFYDEGRSEMASRKPERVPEPRREPEPVVPEQGLQPQGEEPDHIADAMFPGRKKVTPGDHIGWTPPEDDSLPF